MHSNIEHLVNLFRGVRDVRATIRQYCLGADLLTPEMEHLLQGFEQTYGVTVKRYKAPDFRDELLRGVYIRTGNDVAIYLDANLSEDWERYISVKEMAHLILTDPDYMTTEPTDLIENLIHEETAPQDGEAPLDLVADMWTKLAAHEILFPFEVRAAAKAALDAQTTTLFALAQQYGIPEHVIEWTLGKSYMQTCQTVWEKIAEIEAGK